MFSLWVTSTSRAAQEEGACGFGDRWAPSKVVQSLYPIMYSASHASIELFSAYNLFHFEHK